VLGSFALEEISRSVTMVFSITQLWFFNYY